MKFVMMRDRTIASARGHSIHFVKGEPTHVPPALYDEVLAAGGVPEEEIAEPPSGKVVQEPGDPGERQRLIVAEITEMVELNRRDDFTAAGLPHAKVLSTRLGWSVESKERDLAWAAYQNAQGE